MNVDGRSALYLVAMGPLRLDYSAPSAPAWRRRAVTWGVAIALALAAGWFVLFSLRAARARGQTKLAMLAAANANQAMLSAALEQFRRDCGRYPTAAEGLGALTRRPPGLGGWQYPYLSGRATDPWGSDYTYVAPPTPAGGYRIISAGPDTIPGTADDIVVTGPTTQPAAGK